MSRPFPESEESSAKATSSFSPLSSSELGESNSSSNSSSSSRVDFPTNTFRDLGDRQEETKFSMELSASVWSALDSKMSQSQGDSGIREQSTRSIDSSVYKASTDTSVIELDLDTGALSKKSINASSNASSSALSQYEYKDASPNNVATPVVLDGKPPSSQKVIVSSPHAEDWKEGAKITPGQAKEIDANSKLGQSSDNIGPIDDRFSSISSQQSLQEANSAKAAQISDLHAKSAAAGISSTEHTSKIVSLESRLSDSRSQELSTDKINSQLEKSTSVSDTDRTNELKKSVSAGDSSALQEFRSMENRQISGSVEHLNSDKSLNSLVISGEGQTKPAVPNSVMPKPGSGSEVFKPIPVENKDASPKNVAIPVGLDGKPPSSQKVIVSSPHTKEIDAKSTLGQSTGNIGPVENKISSNLADKPAFRSQQDLAEAKSAKAAQLMDLPAKSASAGFSPAEQNAKAVSLESQLPAGRSQEFSTSKINSQLEKSTSVSEIDKLSELKKGASLGSSSDRLDYRSMENRQITSSLDQLRSDKSLKDLVSSGEGQAKPAPPNSAMPKLGAGSDSEIFKQIPGEGNKNGGSSGALGDAATKKNPAMDADSKSGLSQGSAGSGSAAKDNTISKAPGNSANQLNPEAPGGSPKIAPELLNRDPNNVNRGELTNGINKTPFEQGGRQPEQANNPQPESRPSLPGVNNGAGTDSREIKNENPPANSPRPEAGKFESSSPPPAHRQESAVPQNPGETTNRIPHSRPETGKLETSSPPPGHRPESAVPQNPGETTNSIPHSRPESGKLETSSPPPGHRQESAPVVNQSEASVSPAQSSSGQRQIESSQFVSSPLTAITKDHAGRNEDKENNFLPRAVSSYGQAIQNDLNSPTRISIGNGGILARSENNPLWALRSNFSSGQNQELLAHKSQLTAEPLGRGLSSIQSKVAANIEIASLNPVARSASLQLADVQILEGHVSRGSSNAQLISGKSQGTHFSATEIISTNHNQPGRMLGNQIANGRVLSGSLSGVESQNARGESGLGNVLGNGRSPLAGSSTKFLDGTKALPGLDTARTLRAGETSRYMTGLELALVLGLAGITRIREQGGKSGLRLEGRSWAISQKGKEFVILVDGRKQAFNIERDLRGSRLLSFEGRIQKLPGGGARVAHEARSHRDARMSTFTMNGLAESDRRMSAASSSERLKRLTALAGRDIYNLSQARYPGGLELAVMMSLTGVGRLGAFDQLPSSQSDIESLSISERFYRLSGRAGSFPLAVGQLRFQYGLDGERSKESKDSSKENEKPLDDDTNFRARLRDFLLRLDTGDDTENRDGDLDEESLFETFPDINELISSMNSEKQDSSSDLGKIANKIVLIRPKAMIGINQTFESIAVQNFGDPDLAWLIADLNKNVCRESWIEGRRVMEVRSRELLELPVQEDIELFYRQRSKEARAANLVTVVVERAIDREIVENALQKVVGN